MQSKMFIGEFHPTTCRATPTTIAGDSTRRKRQTSKLIIAEDSTSRKRRTNQQIVAVYSGKCIFSVLLQSAIAVIRIRKLIMFGRCMMYGNYVGL
jgi:hypothetical protein